MTSSQGTDSGSKLKVNKKHKDVVANFVSNSFGSITFLFICILFFITWISWNLNLLPALKPFDRYPFPALEMVVSLFAIVLSISVLISQKRQSRMEKIRQHVEFEVNVRAEGEITKMLHMLHEIQKKLGIEVSDKELENMKKSLDMDELHQDAQNDVNS